MNEREYWEHYAPIVGRVWDYDPALVEAIRRPYLERMESFLFAPGGTLVDFGCGEAWASLPLAARGMRLHGIDIAQAQLDRAAATAEAMGVEATFTRSDRFEVEGPVDAVLLHSVVHHLPLDRARALYAAIGRTLRPGGRLFVYEPLGASTRRPLLRLVERGLGLSITLLGRLAGAAGWVEPEIAAAQAEGWTMRSPEEQPLPREAHAALLPPELELRDVRLWHCMAVHYANLCMTLRPETRARARRLLPLYRLADRLLLDPERARGLHSWPMASLEMVRRG